MFLPVDCSQATAIHEGVHAYDDFHDIFLSPFAPYRYWLGGPDPISQTEGLAYAMESILGEYGFSRDLLIFEQRLVNHEFKSEAELQFEWQLVWGMHPLGRMPVFTSSGPYRTVDANDLTSVRTTFGIDTDPVHMTSLYNNLMQNLGYRTFLMLPDPDLPDCLRDRARSNRHPDDLEAR